jgi:hypothetical protein
MVGSNCNKVEISPVIVQQTCTVLSIAFQHYTLLGKAADNLNIIGPHLTFNPPSYPLNLAQH